MLRKVDTPQSPAAEGGGQDELTHLFNLEQSTCLTPLLLGHIPKASYGDNYSDQGKDLFVNKFQQNSQSPFWYFSKQTTTTTTTTEFAP